MKRVLTTTLMALGLLLLVIVSTVLLRSDPEGLPAPDPNLPIHFADGTTRPLSEVLDLVEKGEPLPPTKPLVTLQLPEEELAALPPAERAERERLYESVRQAIEATYDDERTTLFHLAHVARREGRLDEAAALYLSVPEGDPEYGRARRYLAWNVLTKGQDQPRRAVAYANEAVASDPFDGNAWQDLARVYGATLGIDLD